MKPSISYKLLIVGIFTLFLGVKPAAEETTTKVPITSSSQKAIELYLTGRDLSEKLRRADASDYFERAVGEDPNFALAWLGWAGAADNNRSFRERLSRALSLAGRVSEGERLLILATDAALTVEPIKQRRYLRQLVNAFPEDERAHTTLGNLYFVQQDLALAIESFNRALEINPQHSQPYNQLGYCYRQLGNYEKAGQVFERYIALIPDDPNPYDSYAELLLKTGKFEKSIKSYREALSLDPGFVASYLGIASNYIMMGQYDSARAQIQQLLDRESGYGDRRAAIAGLLITDIYEGDIESALKKVRERFQEAEQMSDLAGMAGDLNLIGGILYEQGKYDESIRTSKRGLRIISESDLPDETKYNAERNMLLAEALYFMKMGDIEAAKSKTRKFEELVEKARIPVGMRIAQQIYGMIALETNEFELAIEKLQQSDQQNPYNLFRLAQAYEGAGDKDNARDMYRRVVEFNPVMSLAHAYVLKSAKEKLATL